MSTQILPSEPITLPLLPLRDVVVFPHMVIPLFVGREKSIRALDAAMEGDMLRTLADVDAAVLADAAAIAAGRRVPVSQGYVGRIWP